MIVRTVTFSTTGNIFNPYQVTVGQDSTPILLDQNCGSKILVNSDLIAVSCQNYDSGLGLISVYSANNWNLL